jgi:hypothetical protein
VKAKKDLLPKYYINSNLLNHFFGNAIIDVKPTGSVEMDLGAITKQIILLSPKQVLIFDFCKG